MEETLVDQQGDYERLLRGVEERRIRERDEEEARRLNGDVPSSAERRAKRKIVDVESEDEEDSGGVSLNGHGGGGGEVEREAKRKKEEGNESPVLSD